MSTYFYAMMHRMRYINRWALMRNTQTENIQEHSLEVAVIVHALALARAAFYGEGRFCPSPERCVLFALYHDASEVMTGDLPTPVKYFSPDLQKAYQALEAKASRAMLEGVPEAFKEAYRPYLMPALQGEEDQAIMELVKAADTLSAYIKCLDEAEAGNREFDDAAKHIRKKLEAMELPELAWFMKEALPAYGQSIDQLRAQADV